jgi:hypothetical protein
VGFVGKAAADFVEGYVRGDLGVEGAYLGGMDREENFRILC